MKRLIIKALVLLALLLALIMLGGCNVNLYETVGVVENDSCDSKSMRTIELKDGILFHKRSHAGDCRVNFSKGNDVVVIHDRDMNVISVLPANSNAKERKRGNGEH